MDVQQNTKIVLPPKTSEYQNCFLSQTLLKGRCLTLLKGMALKHYMSFIFLHLTIIGLDFYGLITQTDDLFANCNYPLMLQKSQKVTNNKR